MKHLLSYWKRLAAVGCVVAVAASAYFLFSAVLSPSAKLKHFCNKLGVDSLAMSKLRNISLQPAVSEDYVNRIYFADFMLTRGEFDQFVRSNNLTPETVFSVPATGSKIPSWWHAPIVQPEKFSKETGRLCVRVVWENEHMFLFGHD